MQNFRWFDGSCRKENFCRSAYVSTKSPNTNITVPVVSSGVIVFGAFGHECLGELTMMTGSEQTNTQTACWSQKLNLCFTRNHFAAHLKRPKDGKPNDVPFVILELLVSADFHNPVEQIRRQSSAPQAHKHRHHQLPRIVVLWAERGNSLRKKCKQMTANCWKMNEIKSTHEPNAQFVFAFSIKFHYSGDEKCFDI